MIVSNASLAARNSPSRPLSACSIDVAGLAQAFYDEAGYGGVVFYQ